MKKPNILYIMSDDHSANTVSAYGSMLSEVFKTPNIDRIANEGAISYNCCCSNAICTPSRATIVTGTHSHVNKVLTLADGYDNKLDTFPEILQENGYTTAVVGKWHLHCKPQGFDYFDVLPGQGLYFDPVFLDSDTNYKDVPKDFEGREHSTDFDNYLAKRYGKLNRGHVSDIIADKCLDWLKTREQDKPFMLLCHHKAPHDHFEYHPRDEHLFDGVEIPMPESIFEDKSHRSEASRIYGSTISSNNRAHSMGSFVDSTRYPHQRTPLEGLSEKDKTKATYQRYLKDYMRTVKGIDDNVGRLLDYLESVGELDNTVVIYTSDQGMFLGEHNYMDKRWIYEEALKMPFVIRYPKFISAGTKIEHTIKNVDFAPTILDFAGINKSSQMQGDSFKAILEGEEIEWDNSLYYRYWMHLAHHDVPAHIGVRTPEFKLIYYYGEPLHASGALKELTPKGFELYDLKNDPYELKNVFEDESYRHAKTSMIEMLKKKKSEVQDNDNILDGII